MHIFRQTTFMLIAVVLAACNPATAKDEIRAKKLRGIDRLRVAIGELTPISMDHGVTEELLRTQVELEVFVYQSEGRVKSAC